MLNLCAQLFNVLLIASFAEQCWDESMRCCTALFLLLLFVTVSGSGCVVHKRLTYWEPRGPGWVTKSEGAPQIFHYTNSPGAHLLMHITRTRWPSIAGSSPGTNELLYLSLRLATNMTAQFMTNVFRLERQTNSSQQLVVPRWSEWRISADGVGYYVDREFGDRLHGQTAVVRKYRGVKKAGSMGEYMCYVTLPESLGTSFRVEFPELIINEGRHGPILVTFTNKTEWVWYTVPLQ